MERDGEAWRFQDQEERPESNRSKVSGEPTINSRLDAYVDSLTTPLAGRVHAERLADIRAEIRDHLDALVAANEELLQDPDRAVESAIKQFGRPGLIRAIWRAELRREHRLVNARRAYRWTGCATAAILFATGDRINYDLYAMLLFLVALGMPLCAGVITGAYESHPFKASFQSLWRLFPWAYVTAGAWALLQHFDSPLRAAGLFGKIIALGWFAAGLAGAAIGTSIRGVATLISARVETD